MIHLKGIFVFLPKLFLRFSICMNSIKINVTVICLLDVNTFVTIYYSQCTITKRLIKSAGNNINIMVNYKAGTRPFQFSYLIEQSHLLIFVLGLLLLK